MNKEEFQKRVRNCFLHYSDTEVLIRDLVNQKKNPQDIVILITSRLDSLTNLALNHQNNKKQQDNFIDFLDTFCKSPLFSWKQSVSLPDLYFYLCYYRYRLPSLFTAPGRLKICYPEDKVILSFLWKTGLPVIFKEWDDFLKKLIETVLNIQNSECCLLKMDNLIDEIKNQSNFSEITEVSQEIFWRELKYLFGRFNPGSIFYREYRCRCIHSLDVSIDEKSFYQKEEVCFFEKNNPAVFPHNFKMIGFSANFLLNCLSQGTENFIRKLLHTEKLPIDIFFKIAQTEEDSCYLDEQATSGGKSLNPSF